MAVNRTVIDAAPEKVFGVLSDPESYASWVVGNSEIRFADPAFPAPGSRFGHRLGIGPIGIKDHTSVVEADPPRRLVLRAKARPLASATVDITLTAEGAGRTLVTIDEVLDGELGRIVPRALTDPLVKLRNVESLRRLKRLAER